MVRLDRETMQDNCMRLTAGDAEAIREAAEPVFSVPDEVVFQNFRSVFRTGLNDVAFFNAVMLTFRFAVTGGVIDQECLGYRSQAITSIREKMSSPDMAATVSTLGAIVLVAGVEV